MTITLETLLQQATKEEIYDYAIAIAQALNLPVSSWQAGDPTRSEYHVLAEQLASKEALVSGFISSGFLDYAHEDWLKFLAEQVYGVVVPPASFASTTVTLTNAGGGVYIIDPGDLTVASSLTDKTYHNTTGGTLSAASTLDLTFVADEAGSGSSAGAGEIDTMVTTLLGVTCSNATAAVGIDEQDEAITRQQCRDKLGSLSPDGPADAYRYVARNSDLTGTNAINRVRVYADSDTGDVTVYLAGPSGSIAEPDRVLVETAIATYATPLTITVAVLSASNVSIDVTYELWIYASVNKTALEVEAAIQAALETLFASREIGGDIIPPAVTGSFYKSLIEATIERTFDEGFRVSVTAPTGNTALTNSQVAVLGTVTATINLVTGP